MSDDQKSDTSRYELPPSMAEVLAVEVGQKFDSSGNLRNGPTADDQDSQGNTTYTDDV